MHVRLINPLTIELARLDTAVTRAVGDYDPHFGEPRARVVRGERVLARDEKQPIRLRAQIEDETMDALRQMDAGNSPEAKLTCVVDFEELRAKDLVDKDTGAARINVNDRLTAIYGGRGCETKLVMLIKDPPGLYVVEARPAAIAFDGRANLLILRFADRPMSQQV